mmetsp:Transcript_12987/g.20130  ORF Transcript_12987/g.20130 Transcript_12987/m.20130 type:complete len:120 (+) Transcript_12987:1139-1498(+)
MFWEIQKLLSFNLYAIVCLGFAIGGYITRSHIIDFFLQSSRKLNLQIIMIGFCCCYYLLSCSYLLKEDVSLGKGPDGKKSFVVIDAVIYLFILSVFMGAPQGLIYNSAVYRASGGKSNK